MTSRVLVLGSALSCLTDLRFLSLADSDLSSPSSSFSVSLQQLSQLEPLNLSAILTQVTELVALLPRLTHLRHLDLSENDIDDVASSRLFA